MKRLLFVALASAVLTTSTGCHLLRAVFCNPYKFQGGCAGCGTWQDQGPDCCDPCDTCGNYTGGYDGYDSYGGDQYVDGPYQGETIYDGPAYGAPPNGNGRMRYGTPPASTNRRGPTRAEEMPPPNGSQTRNSRPRGMRSYR